MVEKRKAYIAATLYAMIVGLSFMFVKMALTIATPFDALAHRFTIAWIAASVLLLFKKETINLPTKDIIKIACLAILYPTLFFAFQVFGLVHTSSSEAGIVHASVPIFTLVLASLILREKTTYGQKIAVMLSVLGIIYILYMNGIGDKSISLLGNGLVLLSAVSAALYNVFARNLTKCYSLLTITYIMTLFGLITFNGLAIISHMLNGTINLFMQPFTHLNFVIAMLYLGILSSLGTSYLSNYALSQLQASQMSVFSNLATLITVLAGIVILNEPFHYYHAIGACVIIAGIVGVNYLRD
ncbi:DMT family transporter [Dendrosporobacter sp. 1207_IL3150]|uniref:DMT family transporter n=1 Tax=Dendrosporobacter sp. 1207_IL3150 TaxID=3084054 RepID=UPI002FDB10EE